MVQSDGRKQKYQDTGGGAQKCIADVGFGLQESTVQSQGENIMYMVKHIMHIVTCTKTPAQLAGTWLYVVNKYMNMYM